MEEDLAADLIDQVDATLDLTLDKQIFNLQ